MRGLGALAAFALLAVCAVHAAEQPAHCDQRALRELTDALRANGAEATRASLEQVRDEARRDGRQGAEACALIGLAVIQGIEGDAQTARRMLDDAGTLLAPFGHRLQAQAAFVIATARMRGSATGDHLAGDWFALAAVGFRQASLPRMAAKALQGQAMQQPPGPERRSLLDEALAAARAGRDPAQALALQTLIGEAQRQQGDLRGAIQTLEAAAAGLAELGRPAEAARAWSLLAVSYVAHGEPEQALGAMAKARGVTPDDLNSAAGGHIGLTLAFAASGDCARALRTGDAFRERTPVSSLAPRHHIRMAALAYGYLVCGAYPAAASIAGEVAESFPDLAPAAAYWILSAARFQMGEHEAALAAADQSLERAGQAQVFERVEALHWRARSLDALGRTSSAADAIAEAVALDEQIRDRLVEMDAWRQAFGNRREAMGHDAVAMLWKAGRIEAASSAAESFRARALLETVQGRETQPPGRAWNDPASAADLMRFARENDSTLLSYWAHPEALYVWAVDASGAMHSARVPVSSPRLEALVRRARAQSYKPDREAWRELYRLLISPVASALPRQNGAAVAVIANGPLLQLPFAALLAPSGRYLAEDYALYAAPAGALALRLGEDAPRAPGPVLLVGAPSQPPHGPGGEALPPLPGAARELRRIARLAGPAAQSLLGDEARTAPVAAAAPGASQIYFATHAVVLAEHPLDSYLALSGRDKLTAADVEHLSLNADLVLLSACASGSGAVSSEGLLGFVRAFLFAGASSVIAPLWDIPDEPTAELVEQLYRAYSAGASKAAALRTAQLALLSRLRQGKIRVQTPAGEAILPEHPALWAGFVLTGAAGR
ncbi:MAG: CHAT domain-containing protein [Acidobacteria bacterium]|nr:CHAT domain-containing protein [Acidobacteriota bacterium]